MSMRSFREFISFPVRSAQDTKNLKAKYLPEKINNYTTKDLLQGAKTNTVQENVTLSVNVQ